MTETARVLVVDDEELNRDLLSRRLQRSGFVVECADSGRNALNCLEEHSYDIVLLDSMMPGMSGMELLKLLRAVHSPDQLPVLMVTAVTESARVAEALDMGANDYVTKPVDFSVALARIRSQLARKRDKSALRVSEDRYAAVARGSNDGLWDWDLVTNLIYYSPRWKSMLGCAESEIGEGPEEWLSRVWESDRPRLEDAIREHLDSVTSVLEHEYRMRHADGSCRWILSRGVAVRHRSGRAVRLAGSSTDITDRKIMDALTKLPNRVHLMDRLQDVMGRRGESRNEFALLFLGLDRFKLVNESLGHVMGDHLLIEVARRIGEVLATAPAGASLANGAARIGGDEFTILVEGPATPEAVTNLAERVLRVCGQSFQIDGHSISCSASIGIAFGGPDYTDPEDIVRDADTAMYVAKSRGKGFWVVFEGAMRDRARARLEMETDLRKALEEGQFRVVYQSRVHMATGRIRGFEALARWMHPERGLIGPNEFIPVAEETGLINELGLWVLRESCRQMRAWHDSFPNDPPFDISVNVSALQCQEPELAAEVRQILLETGLPAASLQLEITESLLLTDLDQAKRVLSSLKALGVGLKVDDFGTGYSCLRYLSTLPFDSLKIDRSFTLGLSDGERESEELVKTIIAMARNLKLEAIAEGVENMEQVERLKALGCEYGQGFYYSRPVDADHAAALLREQTGKSTECCCD